LRRAELPAVHPYIQCDVPWLLEAQAERYRDKVFLTWVPFEGPGLRWTYGEFVDRVRRVAGALVARGCRPGDAVILHMPNRPDFLAAWFACSWAGLVAVSTNTNSGRGELKYFAEHSGAKVALTDASLVQDLLACGAHFDWVACLDQAPAGTIPFAPFYESSPAKRRPPDPALYNSIMYTSGTTSRPKAVVFTHANILWSAHCNASHEGLTESDIALVYLPLFHLNALGYSTLATLWSGGSIVLQPKFSPSRWWDVAGTHKCTWTSIGPFVTKALLDLPQPTSHTFRFWGNNWGHDGTIEPQWGIRSLGWYGMTETISHPIISFPGKPLTKHAVGRAAPEYRLRLVDEAGKDIAPGDTGALLVGGVRGLSLFWEYLNDPAATKAAFTDDGWFITGDMITLHPDGSLAFADRKKDMLKVGGENVAASEVEEVILSVPGVVEVAVVGQPHDFLDEVPVAFVVSTDKSETCTAAITAACDRELAKFKRPRAIHYIDALPRLPIGKLDRKVLRERVAHPFEDETSAPNRKHA
jgi:crotonobetaine/carnitine-CoA ligase